jgi:hypothetical protein
MVLAVKGDQKKPPPFMVSDGPLKTEKWRVVPSHSSVPEDMKSCCRFCLGILGAKIAGLPRQFQAQRSLISDSAKS